ncbi:citramalate synthase [Longirhabdus pacifica]|uniref:citramalate synthase n=1 Tax=Longirhabdus pacifica TaxID=2305227 RepID=UPI001008E3A3|nr:citramalate synthase [Longirhabdus pacifica]
MNKQIKIFDTTLRDGTQGEGVSLSVEDKLKITKKLDELGIHYIEGGWPGSNSKDGEFFKQVQQLQLKHAKITAFSSTRKKHIAAHEDQNLQAVIASGVSVASIFGKSWDFHVEKALQTSLEENVRMIEDSVQYLKANQLEVIYLAEHFFDGYKHNAHYAMETIKAAEKGGADWIVLCDTNGGTMPGEITEIVSYVTNQMTSPVGIHTHNDCELAVANSIAAVKAGATQVQGTINGYGERCGNANLCSVIPNLQVKLEYECIQTTQLQKLSSTARFVSEIANMHMPLNQPFVGSSAFAHKGGIHVSAILRHPKTYEHIEPAKVGNRQRVLVSELAGQSNLVFKAEELGLELDMKNEKTKHIIQEIKQLEHQGYQFEGADASLELMLRQASGTVEKMFSVQSFKVNVGKTTDKSVHSEAVVKLKVDEQEVYTVADGNGPVNALDNALRKSLIQYFPHIKNVHLTDYKVRVINETDATAAKVRVLVESTDGKNTWSTVGVSSNVIDASWRALIDSLRYALIGQSMPTVSMTDTSEKGINNH